jgi:hypothetical protein
MKLSCLTWAAVVILVSQAGLAQQHAAEPSSAAVEAPAVAVDVPVEPKSSPDAAQGEKIDKRILGVLPNYRTADGTIPFQPIDWKYKLKIAAKDSFDWPSYLTGAAFAGLYMIDHDHPDFGEGVSGFARYYGTSTADQVIGNMLTEGFMAVAFHEDPRYFRRSHGPKWGRLGYALTRVLVCKTDHGNPTFNFAEVVGNSMGASISNLYYADQRGLSPTMTRAGTQIATDALSNAIKEFWPDVKRHLHHRPADGQALAGN